MIVGSALTIVAIIPWRLFFTRVLLRKMHSERVIFLGDSPVVHEIASHLEAHPEKGLTPLGFLADSQDDRGNASGSDLGSARSGGPAAAPAHRGGFKGAP